MAYSEAHSCFCAYGAHDPRCCLNNGAPTPASVGVQFPPQGWVCPTCKTSYAPWIAQCPKCPGPVLPSIFGVDPDFAGDDFRFNNFAS